jgi:hypothetical protein
MTRKIMKKWILLAVCTALALTAANNPAKLQGVLIDKDSAVNAETRVVPIPSPHLEGGMLWAYTYTRAAAIAPAAQHVGYGIFTYDNKFLPFDPAGSRKALALLLSSKKEDDLRIEATGIIEGDTFRVTSLTLLP